ncbi:hypothetical protein SLE2022_026530 [Rubroshorea leprosula]
MKSSEPNPTQQGECMVGFAGHKPLRRRWQQATKSEKQCKTHHCRNQPIFSALKSTDSPTLEIFLGSEFFLSPTTLPVTKVRKVSSISPPPPFLCRSSSPLYSLRPFAPEFYFLN